MNYFLEQYFMFFSFTVQRRRNRVLSHCIHRQFCMCRIDWKGLCKVSCVTVIFFFWQTHIENLQEIGKIDALIPVLNCWALSQFSSCLPVQGVLKSCHHILTCVPVFALSQVYTPLPVHLYRGYYSHAIISLLVYLWSHWVRSSYPFLVNLYRGY